LVATILVLFVQTNML